MTQDQINHQMLCQIAGHVAEFCIDDEMTALEAVRWVVASYKKLLAEKELDDLLKASVNRHRD